MKPSQRGLKPLLVVGALALGALALIAGCSEGDTSATPADVAAADAPSAPPDTHDDALPAPDLSEPPDVVQPDPEDLWSPPDSVDTLTPDVEEEEPEEPFDPNVTLPLGETLFFDGDDYLYFWGVDGGPVELTQRPIGATATIESGRLTPDTVGEWVLTRGAETITVHVADDLLNEDTFLNFNYTPDQPLALDEDGRLWVASPMSNAVQAVDPTPEGGTVAELVPTGSWPTAVVAWPGTDLLLVSQAGRDTLGFLDRKLGRVVDAIKVGNEPASIVVDVAYPDGPAAFVALSGADAVVRVDLESRTVTGTVAVGHDPRALAYDAAGERLYVASLLSSNATPRGPLTVVPLARQLQHDIAVIDTNSFERVGWINAVGTIIRGLYLSPDDPQTLYAAVSHSANATQSVSASSRPHRHGLAVIDLTQGAGDDLGAVTAIDLDDRASSAGPAPSPFTLALAPSGETLVATLSAGNALLVMDAQTREELGRLPCGSDPRGLVFASGRVWTTAWLDTAVQSWPLAALAAPGSAGEAVTLTVGADPRPAPVRQGQRLFNDASFSGGGDFSCNNCHVDGLTDGLIWNILLDGDVNTLAFRNIGGTAPFLWGGILPTLFDFSREVLRLVGAEASGNDMANLTTYMQSVTAPPNPYTLPGGRFSAAAEKGKALFEAGVGPEGAGCSACHSGPLLTNRTRVVGKTGGVQTDVPSLIGVYDTGPWGRQAQWETLGAMVDFAALFTGAQLNPQQLSDLRAYVEQLPGDLLYLNAALPLDGTPHTFPGTEIALTFSSVLRPGQEQRFALLQTSAGNAPLPGHFELSGRVARFIPDAETLPLDTDFELRVAKDLRSVFGQRTHQALQVHFKTGGVPLVDATGVWAWEVSGLVSGSMTISFIQSAGGQLSGVVLDGGGLIDLDHLEGYVSDKLLQIEPFLVQSPVGQVQVQGAEGTLKDADGDGVADTGVGIIKTPFGSLSLIMTRQP